MIQWIVLLFPRVNTCKLCVLIILVVPNYDPQKMIANCPFWAVVLAAVVPSGFVRAALVPAFSIFFVHFFRRTVPLHLSPLSTSCWNSHWSTKSTIERRSVLAVKINFRCTWGLRLFPLSPQNTRILEGNLRQRCSFEVKSRSKDCQQQCFPPPCYLPLPSVVSLPPAADDGHLHQLDCVDNHVSRWIKLRQILSWDVYVNLLKSKHKRKALLCLIECDGAILITSEAVPPSVSEQYHNGWLAASQCPFIWNLERRLISLTTDILSQTFTY